MVEEWLAAHYGWGEPTQAQPSAGPNDESDWSPGEGPVGIIDGSGDEREDGGGGAHDDRPPPVVTEEAAPETRWSCWIVVYPDHPKGQRQMWWQR